MTAVVTTKGFDVVLVAHVLAAIASFVALAVLHRAAADVAGGAALPPASARSFTGRREVAGRVVHLVPITGLALLGLSRGAFDLSTWFVAVGFALWLVAAAALEAFAFPAQRAVATARKVGASPLDDARRIVRSTEVAGLALVVAAVVMLVGTL